MKYPNLGINHTMKQVKKTNSEYANILNNKALDKSNNQKMGKQKSHLVFKTTKRLFSIFH